MHVGKRPCAQCIEHVFSHSGHGHGQTLHDDGQYDHDHGRSRTRPQHERNVDAARPAEAMVEHLLKGDRHDQSPSCVGDREGDRRAQTGPQLRRRRHASAQ